MTKDIQSELKKLESDVRVSGVYLQDLGAEKGIIEALLSIENRLWMLGARGKKTRCTKA